MPTPLPELKQNFIQGLSQVSRFWGYPKGMGAIFGVLYLSPAPLSLDQLVQMTGLSKGAISTEVRTLVRMGLVHRSSKLADRRDYYEAELDFFKSIRAILLERRNSGLDGALRAVRGALDTLETGGVKGGAAEVEFVRDRIRALQDFFDAIDRLTNAVIKVDDPGLRLIDRILRVLK
jgi:DNA-binding transcriptional regulator GbsR (MarR family)